MTRIVCGWCALLGLLAWSCGNHGVPGPNAPDPQKQAHCAKLSADSTVGCAACAGISYCGWKQTTSPVDGTCHYVQKPNDDNSLISDPQRCPQPPQ